MASLETKIKRPPAEAAAVQDPWKHPPDPWNNDEEEEGEEDFRLVGAPLEESEMDITPMVDVTFLLLIFFMITASFAMQKSLETSFRPLSTASPSLSIRPS